MALGPGVLGGMVMGWWQSSEELSPQSVKVALLSGEGDLGGEKSPGCESLHCGGAGLGSDESMSSSGRSLSLKMRESPSRSQSSSRLLCGGADLGRGESISPEMSLSLTNERVTSSSQSSSRLCCGGEDLVGTASDSRSLFQ